MKSGGVGDLTPIVVHLAIYKKGTDRAGGDRRPPIYPPNTFLRKNRGVGGPTTNVVHFAK